MKSKIETMVNNNQQRKIYGLSKENRTLMLKYIKEAKGDTMSKDFILQDFLEGNKTVIDTYLSIEFLRFL